jgi:polyhydroxyalkanoate synthesis regulator protein
MGGMFPFGALNQMGKQNLAMMEQAMKMFAPFSAQSEEFETPSPTPAPGNEIDDLRRRLDELEREIGGLGKSAVKSG